MKALLQHIVESLVDDPDSINIVETAGESVLIYEIHVSKDDIGKVIGKEGRIANAIRTVMKSAGAKVHKKVTIEIVTVED